MARVATPVVYVAILIGVAEYVRSSLSAVGIANVVRVVWVDLCVVGLSVPRTSPYTSSNGPIGAETLCTALLNCRAKLCLDAIPDRMLGLMQAVHANLYA